MNAAQALAVAAAALVVAVGGEKGSIAFSSASAHAAATLDLAAVRTAVSELADLMERNYVFPDAAQAYANHLRTRAAAGAYDRASDAQELAAMLESELRGVHDDAHLRIRLNEREAEQQVARSRRSDDKESAIGQQMWLADGVGYFRVRGFPGDEASIAAMTRILDELEGARTLIIDARACPGGGIAEIDVLFSRIFAEETHLVTMDTRSGANEHLERLFDETASMRRVDAPATIARWEHWAQPSGAGGLRNANIYLLVGRTASACEHLAFALKETGRATLVGATTRGAGHYGGERMFGAGRFSVFLPVGRTYAPRTGEGWEGVGVAPDRAVAQEEALNEVLLELGLPLTAAANVPPL